MLVRLIYRFAVAVLSWLALLARSSAGLAYVAIIPCDYQVTMTSGTAIRADAALRHAAFERRSCGNGSKGPATATRR